jgi:hypothetical protein
VPVTVKPFIHRELWERGIEALPPTDDETVYEMEETDDLAIGALTFDQEGSIDTAQDTSREQDE